VPWFILTQTIVGLVMDETEHFQLLKKYDVWP
jgi:hypothetical protein